MAPSVSQTLERPPLELLDGSFGLAQRSGDFEQAPLLDISQLDHPALRLRQPFYQFEEHDAAL
jgi:hypothetical protein